MVGNDPFQAAVVAPEFCAGHEKYPPARHSTAHFRGSVGDGDPPCEPAGNGGGEAPVIFHVLEHLDGDDAAEPMSNVFMSAVAIVSRERAIRDPAEL